MVFTWTHPHTSLNVKAPISVAPSPTSPSYEKLKKKKHWKVANSKPNKAMQQSKEEVSHMRFVGDSELLGVVGRGVLNYHMKRNYSCFGNMILRAQYSQTPILTYMDKENCLM
jgi:hypothetical protein